MDVRLRSPLARPVEELRHRELVRIDEQRRAPFLGPSADRLAVIPSGAPDDDETGIARGVLGAGVLVEGVPRGAALVLGLGGVEPADEVAEPAARGVDVQEMRARVAGDGERVHDVRRHEHHGPGIRPNLAILEPERQLALEHEEALRVPSVVVERRSDTAARIPAHRSDPDLLEVREEGDAEAGVPRDLLALTQLHGGPA